MMMATIPAYNYYGKCVRFCELLSDRALWCALIIIIIKSKAHCIFAQQQYMRAYPFRVYVEQGAAAIWCSMLDICSGWFS